MTSSVHSLPGLLPMLGPSRVTGIAASGGTAEVAAEIYQSVLWIHGLT